MRQPSIYRLLGLPRPSKHLFRILRGPYSQDELARTLKVYPQTVQSWEQRRADPAAEHLRALHEHFLKWAKRAGCDPRRLLTPAAALRTRRADEEEHVRTPAAPPPTAADTT